MSVPLGEAITSLRLELLEAFYAGDQEMLRFRLDPIELTLQVVVSVEGGAKVGWKILEASAKADRAVTQTIKLQLTPFIQDEDGAWKSGALIASPGAAADSFGPQ